MTATTTKLKGMLFAGEMVRALLNTRIGEPGPIDAALPWKGQTRRLIPPLFGGNGQCDLRLHNGCIEALVCNQWTPCVEGAGRKGQGNLVKPRFQPGDVVAVKEKFQPVWAEVDVPGDWKTGDGYKIWYCATDGITEWMDADGNISSRCMPSIHMPFWASRIHLRITKVRVERLQEISTADAIAEGITIPQMLRYDPRLLEAAKWAGGFDAGNCELPRVLYRDLWDSISPEQPWESNPFVFVYSFERVK